MKDSEYSKIQEPTFCIFTNPSSKVIENIFRRADLALDNMLLSSQEREQRANITIDQLGLIEGIVLREIRSYNEDSNYRCAEYAVNFPGTNNNSIWHSTEKVLREKGYQLITDEAQRGDIIVYGERRGSSINTQHFGIYLGINNRRARVISKFGRGHIVEHDIDLVLPAYGNQVCFYRKVV